MRDDGGAAAGQLKIRPDLAARTKTEQRMVSLPLIRQLTDKSTKEHKAFISKR